ncbi:MAG: putative bifunctional diguanylate cyclase/phosphodiesterase [Gammaproteobacteria bacterium]
MTLELRRAVTERDRFFELSLDLMGIAGFDGHFKQINEAWSRTLGHETNALKARPLMDFIHPENRTAMEKVLRLVAHSDERRSIEVQFSCRDGVYRWLSCSVAAYPREQLYYIAARDITDRVNAQQRLVYDTRHDSLTGLLNRNGFLERLESAITLAQQDPEQRFAILFLDLDRFKIINDSLGHLAGDEMLVETAARLCAAVHSEDVVGRLGGDEFIILVPEINDTSDAIHLAAHLLKRLKQAIRIFGHEVFTTASIGITLSSRDDHCAAEILRDADIAMYFAKAQGKSRYAVFDRSMHENAVAQLQLENDLRRALENDEFILYYQPIVSMKSGTISGFESLIRWRHPVKGLISPLDFIPLAEETGLIIPLGKWVLEQACRQLKAWQASSPSLATLTMNVNISARQFWQHSFARRLQQTLKTEGLDPATLGLEITESVIMHDADKAARLFRKLKATGVNIYIDDFGTGYSSLSYLHRFHFDGIKIDRSFVKGMETKKANHELVGTIMLFAKNLQLRVIAEGVETENQVRLLSQLNCEWVQGFLSSRPLPAESAEDLLKDQVLRHSRILKCC